MNKLEYLNSSEEVTNREVPETGVDKTNCSQSMEKRLYNKVEETLTRVEKVRIPTMHCIVSTHHHAEDGYRGPCLSLCNDYEG